MDKEQLKEQAKLLLGIDGDDDILSLLIDDTINLVLGYCRIEELPTRLESLIPVMTADRYRMSDYGKVKPDKVLVSNSQGSRSESYANPNIFDDSFLKDYESRLKPFICKRGYVPSDFDEPDDGD